MKKSIFLIFAAILCAMTANAKMVYLKPSSNWKEAGAIFYVWYWTGSGSGTAGKMQQLELGLYGYDIGNNTSFLITRNKSTAGDPWTDNWGQTGDLTYNANKPCYYVKNWNENGSGLIALPSAHIAGATDLTGHNWSANASENKMTKQNDGTWTLTKTIATINQGDYGYKVTDGSWDWSLGKNSNDDATINIPATGKYSVTFTYNPSANTVSAVATPIYSVTVNSGEGGTASGTGECVSGNSVNISAEALENYEFLNWTIESGTGSFGNTSEASTTFQPTSNATIQANFRSTVTYSLTLQGGTGIASVTGNNDNVTLNQSYNISAEIVDGYSFAGWTADVAANADITDASLASTSVVVKNGSVVLTASATEITSTLTTANTYSEGTPDIAAPTASVSKVGVATIATITAASNAAYALTSWTLTNCERTDGGAENATEITVKGLGNNNEASVVANYTKIPTETVYLINTEAWETVMVYHWNPQGAAYPGAEMTKTGETIATFDVYEYTFAGSPQGLVFSCGGDECKTGDLTWEAGKYYAPSTGEWYADAAAAEAALAAVVTYDYYIAGPLAGGWNATQMGMEKVAEGQYTCEFTKDAGDYQFKVTNGKWGNETGGFDCADVEGSYEEVSNVDGNVNVKLTTTTTFTVKFDSNTKKISFEGLTEIIPTYTVAGDSEAAFGTTWDPTNTANDMALEGGLYKWTKTNVALYANTVIKFQVVKNHDWAQGQWPGQNNDRELKDDITADGLYTITITFKEDDKTITATATKTGDIVTKDFSNQPATLYFHPSFHWTSDAAQFAAYFYNNGPGADATPTWVNMTDGNGDGIYEVANAKQHEYVIICRMNPSRTENKWDDDVMWNQIESGITIPNTAGDLNTCLAFWTNCQGDVPTSECTWVAPTPLTDKNWADFVTDYADKTINAVVERSFKSGQLHTLCLPFDLSTSWLGDGAQAHQITSVVSRTAEELELKTTQCNTLLAGQPYIIQPIKGEEYEHIIVSNVTVKNVTASEYTVLGGGCQVTMQAISATDGTQTNGTTEYYIGADDGKLYKGVVDKLGLRALVVMTDTDGHPLSVRARVVVGENEETGIENIITTDALVKVIENGQLIIIRGGEKFNAQGQKL